jgi:hypothetical protein
MSQYAYNITDTKVTVFWNSQTHVATDSHPLFKKIREKVVNEETDGLLEMFDQGQAVIDYTDGNISVESGVVLYRGEPVHNVLVDKILGCMSEGVMYKRLIRFLDKLMQNPSRRAVTELYRFLEHKNMPITPEGDFVAYKGVNSNFTDRYSGKFDNSVGQTLEMTRNSVCDDASIGCSDGFHAGSYEYANGYTSGGGHLMAVQINPADVVSVPNDCDCQKLRTAKYKVVGLVKTIIETEATDDYYDGDEDLDAHEDAYNEQVAKEEDAYNEGYQQAKEDLVKNLLKN